MPNLFSPDLFTAADLTAAVNKIPYVPTLLGRFFETASSRTTSVAIDVKKGQLRLVADSARGIPGPAPAASDARDVKVIRTAHLLQTDTVFPDDVQDVRAFGSTELETISQRITARQAALRRNLEATLEFHRVGAVKGQVLDADGSTVLHDIFSTFGISRPSDVTLTWPAAATGKTNEVLSRIQDVVEGIEDAMGGVAYDGIMAICGSSFWKHLTENPFVREAYNLWAANRPSFGDAHDWASRFFSYGGITFVRYSRTVGGNTLVESSKAQCFPVGPGIFKQIFAPADWEETVNTDGIPYYSRMDPLPRGRGEELEVQTNPLTICMFPEALRTIAGAE